MLVATKIYGNCDWACGVQCTRLRNNNRKSTDARI